MNSSRAEGAAGAAALSAALAGLGAAGAAGNLLFAAVLAHQLRRGPPGPSRALLLSLCGADLLLLAAGLLPALLAAAASCRPSRWLLHACLAAKSFGWAALGRARCQPLQAPPGSPGWSGARLAGLVSGVWAAALLLPLPLLLFSRPEAGRCLLRGPPSAARFLDAFGGAYPLAAFVAPSACSWAGFGRALRAPRGRRLTGTLLGLALLFQATCLPAWLAWLWERRAGAGAGAGPPPALAALARALLSLDAALGPALFAAAAADCRRGLRGLAGGGAKAGPPPETPHPLPGLEAEAPSEKVPPDVEHFWKDRRDAAAGEESDPIPWEHQGQP